MTYWCMKLYEELKRSHTSNDDFDEAFNEHRKQFHELLIQLFQSSHSQCSLFNVITNDLIPIQAI